MHADRTYASLKAQERKKLAQDSVNEFYARLHPEEKAPDFTSLNEQSQDRLIKLIRASKGFRNNGPIGKRNSLFLPELSGDEGYVYFVQSSHNHSTVKIGWTNRPSSRISSLQTGSPVDLRMIYLFKGYLSKNTEANFQRKYKTRRLRGEWFKFTSEQLDSVEVEFKGRIMLCEKRYDREIDDFRMIA